MHRGGKRYQRQIKSKHGGLQQLEHLIELGWGVISTVERLTGMSHTTIRKGIRELQSGGKLEPPERLRDL